jgi:hypothetical protein
MRAKKNFLASKKNFWQQKKIDAKKISYINFSKEGRNAAE